MTGRIIGLTEKPRIVLDYDKWACISLLRGKRWWNSDRPIIGRGKTPRDAYAAWWFKHQSKAN